MTAPPAAPPTLDEQARWCESAARHYERNGWDGARSISAAATTLRGLAEQQAAAGGASRPNCEASGASGTPQSASSGELDPRASVAAAPPAPDELVKTLREWNDMCKLYQDRIWALEGVLRQVREDINWMLNNRKWLNPDVFDYLDRALGEQGHE